MDNSLLQLAVKRTLSYEISRYKDSSWLNSTELLRTILRFSSFCQLEQAYRIY